MTATEARAAQERDWIQRLMAAAPAESFGEGAHLARGIVHPMCYRRASAEGDAAQWDDPGWRPLYRIMLMTIEDWCAKHPRRARRAAGRMTFEDMLWLWYKEKWGVMRWEIHGGSTLPRSLRETIARTEWVLETASASMCQRCGRASQVRGQERETQRGRQYYGWVNTVCDACHRAGAHEKRELAEARWAQAPAAWERRSGPPPSRTETDVGVEDYLARLRPYDEATDAWHYARDVLEEWEARRETERGAHGPLRPRVHCAAEAARTPAEPATHRVTLARWRYEEAVVEIDAGDAEEAAALAGQAETQWTASARTSEAFVESVEGEAPSGPRTALRIEERHGETARLTEALEARREAAQAMARGEPAPHQGAHRRSTSPTTVHGPSGAEAGTQSGKNGRSARPESTPRTPGGDERRSRRPK